MSNKLDAYLEEIGHYLSDREAREEILKEIRERYAWEGIAEQTLSVYQEVLGEGASAAARPERVALGPGVRPRYLIAETGSTTSAARS